MSRQRSETSIFEQMSMLAREHDAVNLGQGFPDFGWPESLLAAAADAVLHGSNQYPPMRGLPELRHAVATHYSRRQDVPTQAAQVIITSGATEALASAILTLVQPGDEVVLFEPLYDAYLPMVRRAGGIPRLVRLAPPDWRIHGDALDAAISEHTRLIIFNNPHNPTGRVFEPEEVQLVAEACVRSGAIALSDEVWEHLVFDGARHLPLASLPGMAERVVKIGSAGKIFSLTGWKVGWAVAPPDLAEAIAGTHQFLTFATAAPLQRAVAEGLEAPLAVVEESLSGFAEARDHLRSGLADAGFKVLDQQGTYFLCIDLAASGITLDDEIFCERAVREHKIAAIPLSPFFDGDPLRSIMRLCFAKKSETLDLSITRLAQAREAMRA